LKLWHFILSLTKRFGGKSPSDEIISTIYQELQQQSIKEPLMLYTIAVILIILWLLGLVTSYTLGGFVHILLVIAIVMILLRVISGRPPL
jgi:hypothetical protein